MTVYLDLVVFLNFLVDFLLLMGTNRLSGFPTDWRKAAAGALLGGLYAGACLLPGFRFLGNLLWRTVSLILIGLLAFGWNRSAVKRSGVFLLLSMALGGMAVSINRTNIPVLVLAAGFVWALSRAVFADAAQGREYVNLEIARGARKVSLVALRDSGNTLRDPITGEQVLVIDGAAAGILTGLTENQLRAPLETLAAQPVPGLRLIPYRAVGCSGGMLLAMRFEEVKIGSRVQSAVVAFAPEGLGEGSMYQALVGGVL